MANKTKVYVIPHTHWDREWRYPLWKNRVLLIEFMEQLIHILETDDDYNCFLLDGQVAPILDYLEVAPYDTEKIKKYVQDGRIAIGPWYTLPDLYPIDGECMVRNLLKGIEVCREFGGHQTVGYNTFGWGQTAQLPQIYSEFGIDNIICAKKVSKERAPQSEFMWESPDGTRILTSRLGSYTRANFFFHTYINTRFNTEFLSDQFIYDADKAGVAVHNASVAKQSEDYFITEHRNDYNYDKLAEGIEKSIACTEDTVMKDTRLFLSGCDFSTPQEDLTPMLYRMNSDFPEYDFVNARLEDYMDDLKQVDQECLKVVHGELRDGPSCDCSGNALASRSNIKQLNKKAQNNLILKSEPLSVIADMKGHKYPSDFYEIAWKYMLDSHPHDSINGVTQDKTADDVMFRLNQANEIAEVLYDEAAHAIIGQIDYSEVGDMSLTVFNPLFHESSGVLEVCVDFPSDQNVWSFDIIDMKGNKLAVAHKSREEYNCPVHDMNGRPWPIYTDRHICYVHFTDIPAMGYASYKIVPNSNFIRNRHYWFEMRKTAGNEIAKSEKVLDNGKLKVTFNANGSFNLLNKETGYEAKGLNYFEDTGDVGNYWAYYPPYENRTFTTVTSAPSMWLEENNSLSATMVVAHELQVPAYGNEPLYGVRGKSSRSKEMTTLHITSRVTLTKDSDKVDIKTTVDNTAKNHRLRVVLPTGIRAEHSDAAGHFTVDRRPIISTRDENDEYYNEMQTLPMQSFVDLYDGYNGLAVLNNCLTEFEAKEDGRVYLTLFRAVNNMIVTAWEAVGRFPEQDGSQMPGEHTFEYSIYPHKGSWDTSYTYSQAQKLNTPMNVYQVMGGSEGVLSPVSGFVKISDKNVIVSSLKKAEEGKGYVLRLFNPTEEVIEFSVTFDEIFESVYYLKMDETCLDSADLKHLTIGKKKIMTLGLYL